LISSLDQNLLDSYNLSLQKAKDKHLTKSGKTISEILTPKALSKQIYVVHNYSTRHIFENKLGMLHKPKIELRLVPLLPDLNIHEPVPV